MGKRRVKKNGKGVLEGFFPSSLLCPLFSFFFSLLPRGFLLPLDPFLTPLAMSAKKKEDKGKVGKRKRGEKRHFISARPTPRPLAAAMAAAATTTGEKKKKSPSPRGPSFVVRGKCGICQNKIPKNCFSP